jgi:hypothetical protein
MEASLQITKEKMETQSAKDILFDKTRASISINETAFILGISAQTLRAHIKKTGKVCDGVPLLKVGATQRVPLLMLRKALAGNHYPRPPIKKEQNLVELADYLSVIAWDMSRSRNKNNGN